jgi:hypothetical protein
VLRSAVRQVSWGDGVFEDETLPPAQLWKTGEIRELSVQRYENGIEA